VIGERLHRPDPGRLAAGWEFRFVADARRAEEAVELYDRLGFEVEAVQVESEVLDEDCADCQIVMLLKYKAIYTRRRRGGLQPA
jgi:hypothetical protein